MSNWPAFDMMALPHKFSVGWVLIAVISKDFVVKNSQLPPVMLKFFFLLNQDKERVLEKCVSKWSVYIVRFPDPTYAYFCKAVHEVLNYGILVVKLSSWSVNEVTSSSKVPQILLDFISVNNTYFRSSTGWGSDWLMIQLVSNCSFLLLLLSNFEHAGS